MGRFVEHEVKVIHAEWWDEEETVTIKRFAYGDRQRLASVAYKVGFVQQGDGGQQEFSADIAIGEMNLAILEIGIEAWTLKSSAGKAVPLRRSAIERLQDEDAEFILREINAFNPSRKRRTADEQANFRGRGGDGAADGEPVAG